MFPVHCKLTDPDNGYKGEQARAHKLLEANGPDHVYTIQNMNVGQSSTSLYFYSHDRNDDLFLQPWNSVQFSPCDMFGNMLGEEQGCCIEASMCGHGDEL